MLATSEAWAMAFGFVGVAWAAAWFFVNLIREEAGKAKR